jgi:hypothetical protein
LKAHEVEEHGNGLLSRQQRAKQAEMRRVDININYSGASGSQRQRQQPQQQNFTMTAEDFPAIGGIASALPQVSLAAQRKEDWPTLGEESGRSSPNISEENPSGAGSRSAAALDRISDLFKNFDKLVKFRQLTTSFTSLSITADDYVDKVYNLCGKNAEFTAKVLENTKDLVENRALKSDMVRTWNRKKNSVSNI